MIKNELVVAVTAVLLMFPANCLFAGENCVAEESNPGRCIALSTCAPLLDAIRSAGAPMPARLRIRLQALTCGFEADEPLVCCEEQNTNGDDNKGNPLDWRPPTHGLGGGSNWGTPEPSWNTQLTTKPTPAASSHNSPAVDIENHRNIDLLPNNCGIVESDKIWGGNRTRLYEMPWMVLVKYDSPRGTKLSCGGTLITERYVLTAAHCVSFLGNRLTLNAILLGEYDVRKDPDCERAEGEVHCAPSVRNVSIEKVIAHPGYNPQNLYDDIALVRLSEPADFTLDSMKPICLPTTYALQTESLVGKPGIVAGWGATEDGLQSPVLLSVDLPMLDNQACQDAYNGNPQIYQRQVCAGGVQDKDSCGGDSGGPLMFPGRIRSGAVRYVQRGIVSYGSKRCGAGGFPGVYTRVSHYMDWILDNISR